MTTQKVQVFEGNGKPPPDEPEWSAAIRFYCDDEPTYAWIDNNVHKTLMKNYEQAQTMTALSGHFKETVECSLSSGVRIKLFGAWISSIPTGAPIEIGVGRVQYLT